ncbi:uncharacterized protein [Macrobrachium rosenbergii]|uniref:uncharacterized protein n=1 Tax=Macrobrachium rosenbergii TaxID=79674 RepID=UPI0034D77E60
MDSGSTDEVADDCTASRNRDYLIDFLPDILLGTVPFADPRQITRRTPSSPPPIDPGEKDLRDTIHRREILKKALKKKKRGRNRRAPKKPPRGTPSRPASSEYRRSGRDTAASNSLRRP